jgi:hypothetical protein
LISPGGILLAASFGIVNAVTMGIVYSIGIAYIPYIYINGIFTVFFGYEMGQAVGWGAKFGKVREPFVAAAYGFVIGLIGLYVAWGADFISRVIVRDECNVDYWTAFSPEVLLSYIQVLYAEGDWGFSAGQPVKGVELAVIWVLEAAIILGGSTWFALQQILHHPFCEKCNRWTDFAPGVRTLSMVVAEDAMKTLLEGDLTSLRRFSNSQDERNYLQLDMASCPTCDESHYLTIYQVKLSRDENGKLKKDCTPLLRDMHVAAEDLPLIAGEE